LLFGCVGHFRPGFLFGLRHMVGCWLRSLRHGPTRQPLCPPSSRSGCTVPDSRAAAPAPCSFAARAAALGRHPRAACLAMRRRRSRSAFARSGSAQRRSSRLVPAHRCSRSALLDLCSLGPAQPLLGLCSLRLARAKWVDPVCSTRGIGSTCI
jgi:hypothetical protein